MKRILSGFLVIVLLNPLIAHAEATDRRGLIEFVELYTQRITEYQKDNGIDCSRIFESFVPPWTNDNYLIFGSTAGSIGVNQEDYTVHDVIMTLCIPSKSDSDNDDFVISCIASIAALEYDSTDDSIFKLIKSSAMERAKEIMDEVIAELLVGAMAKAVASNQKVNVYSGNYDYYVDYYAPEGHEFLYLIAEERQ